MGFDRIPKKAPFLIQCRGFTLLELLIAITIFALIASASYRLLKSVTLVEESSIEVWDRTDEILRAKLVLEKDLLQLAIRPIMDESGQQLPALIARQNGKLLEFTRSGWRNFTKADRSDLQRVSYEFTENQLIRHYWPVLDRGVSLKPQTQVLMSNVDNIRFRFRDSSKGWHDIWPPPYQKASLRPYLLPALVEVSIEHPHYGDIRMQLPGVTYQQKPQERQTAVSPNKRRSQQ
ncbi:MAG: type II secretion system minor pseudopilin GspJ [Endozoicomonadaceae bacterium]|nr:type II secretion system minor pseudopilin GspJ [Endozoicomonadaceae bacterium]